MYLDSGDNNNALLHNMAMRDFPSKIGNTPLLKGTQEKTHYPHMATHGAKQNKGYINFSLVILIPDHGKYSHKL